MHSIGKVSFSLSDCFNVFAIAVHQGRGSHFASVEPLAGSLHLRNPRGLLAKVLVDGACYGDFSFEEVVVLGDRLCCQWDPLSNGLYGLISVHPEVADQGLTYLEAMIFVAKILFHLRAEVAQDATIEVPIYNRDIASI